MKVSTETTEKNQVQLEITVEAEEFEKAVQKSYIKNVKSIQVPGFRKGKAPRKMIEKVYGEGVFYDDAVDFILQDTYPQAIEEAKIEPVSRPEVEIKEIGSGKDFVYTAKVYVKPEVTLGEYKGIKVEKVEYTVSDDDVKAEIDNMMERAARFVDVTDKPIEDGNVAVIDFEGFVDGVAFEGGKAENHNLTIGSGQFIPGFEEQLIGKNIGEECEVNVKFPEEYHASELAGKDATFKVKINGIKNKEYPELDDEFAKDVSEFETLDELKAKTRERLEENAKKRTQREQDEKVLESVCANAQVEIPDAMIENQLDEYVRDAKYRLQMQMPGITFEQYLEYTGTNLQDFKESMRERAGVDVKTNLVIEAVAKAENISVSDEEVQKELENIAQQYKMEIDKVKELVNEEQVRESLVPRKTVEFLRENAVIG